MNPTSDNIATSDKHVVPIENKQATLITNRFEPVGVCRVVDVKAINLQRYEETKNVTLAGYLHGRKQRDQAGMLSHADVEIYLELNEEIPNNHIAVNVEQGVAVTAKHTFVTVGKTTDMDCYSEEATKFVKILLPLSRGLASDIPLFDEVHLKGNHYIHHTIRIEGKNADDSMKDCVFNIRIRVSEENGLVEIMSVSTSMIDAARISQSFGNLKDFVLETATKTKELVVGCFTKTKEPKEEPVDTTHQLPQQYIPQPLPAANLYPAPVPLDQTQFMYSKDDEGNSVMYYAVPTIPGTLPTYNPHPTQVKSETLETKYEVLSDIQ